MPSYYSVIRYVPNPLSEESVNIGVVVFGGGTPLFRFLRDWSRPKKFGGESTDFLERFAKQLSSTQLGIFSDSGAWSEERLHSVLGRWHNSIQFTNPRASLHEPAALLEDVAQTFLRQSKAKEVRRRTKLYSQVKTFFRRMKVLAKEPRDIDKHRVVTDYAIDKRTGLFAEFALKNSAVHVMETVDYRSAAPSGLAKFYETGAKSLVLMEAREKLGKNTKGYVVYSSHPEDRSTIRKYLALLEAHADHLFNYDSKKDLAAFGSLVSRAADRADLIHFIPDYVAQLQEAAGRRAVLLSAGVEVSRGLAPLRLPDRTKKDSVT
jgi:DUF3037 family protein